MDLYIFQAEVAGTEEIKFWIMNWGAKAGVLETESFREDIRAETEAMMNKYNKGFEKEETPLRA